LTAVKPERMAPRVRRAPSAPRERVLAWSTRVISAGTLVVVAWIAITAFPMLIHGQPVYVVLLGITAIAAVLGTVFAWRARANRGRVPRYRDLAMTFIARRNHRISEWARINLQD
jgi:hypothetical protein